MKGLSTTIVLATAIAAVTAIIARAEPQQARVYDSSGRSVGTIVPQGEGTNRYYDSRGHSLGTSTTTGNTTKFYGPRGNVTGTVTGGRR